MADGLTRMVTLRVGNLDERTKGVSRLVGAETDSHRHEELTPDTAGKIPGAVVTGSFMAGLETYVGPFSRWKRTATARLSPFVS